MAYQRPRITRPIPSWLSSVQHARLERERAYRRCEECSGGLIRPNNRAPTNLYRQLYMILGLALATCLASSFSSKIPFYFASEGRALYSGDAVEPTQGPDEEVSMAAKESRSPAIVSYPDANVTRPANKNEQRPYFIFHVGPPKSATTTFQTEMTRYRKHLTKDNYNYLGQRMASQDNLFQHVHGRSKY